MTSVLAVFAALYAGFLGCWALVCAGYGGRLGAPYLGGLLMLELTLLARAGIELAGLFGAPGGFGRGYAEPEVHAGYALASVTLLPLLLAVTRTGGGRTAGRRWDALVAAVACAAAVIVTARMSATGRPS